MKGLFIKEMITTIRSVRFLFIPAIVGIGAAYFLYNPSAQEVLSICLILSVWVMMFQNTELDRKSEWKILLVSLPISRTKAVMSKFLFLTTINLVLHLFYFVLRLAVSYSDWKSILFMSFYLFAVNLMVQSTAMIFTVGESGFSRFLNFMHILLTGLSAFAVTEPSFIFMRIAREQSPIYALFLLYIMALGIVAFDIVTTILDFRWEEKS
ncbi:MAG: ABC-2 transporter permease [Peptostreptococcaceae bacterium]|nr:ABC-2 transporter permease [Peptostreptococcaceae bacterium]